MARTLNSKPKYLPERDSPAYREIARARETKRRDVRDQIALGILPPEGANQQADQHKLAILIQRERLRDSEIVAEAQRLAKGEARVIYTGPVKRYARVRPLRVGSSIGHPQISAGTLGCFCLHGHGGLGILSNNHVLANVNKAAVGDVILQPGRDDGGRRGTRDDRIATLFSYEPIRFEPDARNLVDAAFATLQGGMAIEGNVSPDSEARPLGLETAELIARDEVFKYGRTTGFTKGRVVALAVDNLIVTMVFGTGERIARFDRQIAIEGVDGDFSQPGDSGSLIINEDDHAVGLLFAGSDRGGSNGRGVTFANPIATVLDTLELQMYHPNC